MVIKNNNMKKSILISFLFIAVFANAQMVLRGTTNPPSKYANRMWQTSGKQWQVGDSNVVLNDSLSAYINFADTLKVYYFQYKFPDFSMWAEMVAKCYHRPTEKECEDYMLSLDKKYKTCKARNLIELKGVKPEGVSDIIPTKK